MMDRIAFVFFCVEDCHSTVVDHLYLEEAMIENGREHLQPEWAGMCCLPALDRARDYLKSMFGLQ